MNKASGFSEQMQLAAVCHCARGGDGTPSGPPVHFPLTSLCLKNLCDSPSRDLVVDQSRQLADACCHAGGVSSQLHLLFALSYPFTTSPRKESAVCRPCTTGECDDFQSPQEVWAYDKSIGFHLSQMVSSYSC